MWFCGLNEQPQNWGMNDPMAHLEILCSMPLLQLRGVGFPTPSHLVLDRLSSYGDLISWPLDTSNTFVALHTEKTSKRLMIVLQNRWDCDKTAQISDALGHGRCLHGKHPMIGWIGEVVELVHRCSRLLTNLPIAGDQLGWILRTKNGTDEIWVNWFNVPETSWQTNILRFKMKCEITSQEPCITTWKVAKTYINIWPHASYVQVALHCPASGVFGK